jgi:hypothetical protein
VYIPASAVPEARLSWVQPQPVLARPLARLSHHGWKFTNSCEFNVAEVVLGSCRMLEAFNDREKC